MAITNKCILECLVKAKEKLKKGWCQRTYAVNKYGVSTAAESKDAAKFCALGSIYASTKSGLLAAKCRICLSRQIEKYNIAQFNDKPTTKKEDVIKVFNKAINALKKG